jgi:ketosteroid isomerase-like protein
MPDPTPHPRLAITREFLQRVARADLAEAVKLLSDDVTYRAEGNNALAGSFSGRDGVVRHLLQIIEKTRGTFETFKWEDWMVGEHHVVGLGAIHAQAEGRIFRGRTLTLVSFNIADEIHAITVFFEEPDAMDRFIGR